MKNKNITKTKAFVCVDGANMFYAQQKMGWFIDWQKIKNWLSKEYKINKIVFYSGLKKNDSGMIKFLNKLKKYGFIVKTKPLKKIYIDHNKFVYKANFDVEISVDALLEKGNFDYLILFSGDSDFEYLVNNLKILGKKVVVVSSSRALSYELKNIANKFFLLGGIRKEIQLIKSPRPEGRG